MSRESKIINSRNTNFDAQSIIKHYESFGWELLSIGNGIISLTRETQNPVYSDLVKYEHEYEELCKRLSEGKGQIKHKRFNFLLFLVLFALGFIPGIFYVAYLISLKIKNNKLESEIKKLTQEIADVCNKSSATFFKRQSN